MQDGVLITIPGNGDNIKSDIARPVSAIDIMSGSPAHMVSLVSIDKDFRVTKGQRGAHLNLDKYQPIAFQHYEIDLTVLISKITFQDAESLLYKKFSGKLLALLALFDFFCHAPTFDKNSIRPSTVHPSYYGGGR